MVKWCVCVNILLQVFTFSFSKKKLASLILMPVSTSTLNIRLWCREISVTYNFFLLLFVFHYAYISKPIRIILTLFAKREYRYLTQIMLSSERTSARDLFSKNGFDTRIRCFKRLKHASFPCLFPTLSFTTNHLKFLNFNTE